MRLSGDRENPVALDHDEPDIIGDTENNWYFGKLDEDERERLDRETLLLRNDPKTGTNDPAVMKHTNMDTKHDNLYFVCYPLKTVNKKNRKRLYSW